MGRLKDSEYTPRLLMTPVVFIWSFDYAPVKLLNRGRAIVRGITMFALFGDTPYFYCQRRPGHMRSGRGDRGIWL